jgi:hypothetical protein
MQYVAEGEPSGQLPIEAEDRDSQIIALPNEWAGVTAVATEVPLVSAQDHEFDAGLGDGG